MFLSVLLNVPISQGLDVQLNASQVIINHFKVAQLISFHTQRKPTLIFYMQDDIGSLLDVF